jgi:hypothetical protein
MGMVSPVLRSRRAALTAPPPRRRSGQRPWPRPGYQQLDVLRPRRRGVSPVPAEPSTQLAGPPRLPCLGVLRCPPVPTAWPLRRRSISEMVLTNSRTVRLSTAHHERLGHSVARYPQHVRKLLLHAHGCAVLPFPPPSMPASVHCARSTRALRWVPRIAGPPAPSTIAPEARRPTRQCDWTSPVGSRQASVIYLPGSVPVIFLMPLAPARSTAAFTTAKIAPWTAAAINTSLVL